MKRRKGFTLVELLVVIGIIAMLVAILLPALARAKQLAKQALCASNLKGLGTTIVAYYNDYRGIGPRIKSEGDIADNDYYFGGGYYNLPAVDEGDITSPDSGGKWRWLFPDDSFQNHTEFTVGGALYLLVKYEDVSPESFLCPSAPYDVEMEWELFSAASGGDMRDWTDMHDFFSSLNLSYSYNDPYYRVVDDTESDSQAVMADKSNAYDGHASDELGLGVDNSDAGSGPYPGPPWTESDASAGAHGNSNNHATECQNVMFNDAHVKKYNIPTVGVAEDNIYTYWSSRPLNIPDADRLIGDWCGGTEMFNDSVDDNDAYLGN